MAMVQGWDETTKHADAVGRFLRLKAGESAVVVFCGVPLAIDRVVVDEHYVTYDPKVHGNAKRSSRFFMNVFDAAQRSMKIMEGGKPWFESVLAVRRKYGLDKSVFEVSRVGEGKQTKYTVMYHEPLSPQLTDAIHAAELHDLAAAIAENDAAFADEAEAATSGAAPAAPPPRPTKRPAPTEPLVDAATAEGLRQRFATLGPDIRDAFRKAFAVQRLNDLPAARLPDVLDWLDAQADL